MFGHRLVHRVKALEKEVNELNQRLDKIAKKAHKFDRINEIIKDRGEGKERGSSAM